MIELKLYIKKSIEFFPTRFNIVNNVGISYEYPDEFHKVPIDTVWNMIMTNVAAMTMMTHIIIDKMKQHKKGLIVNVSSGCSVMHVAYHCVYAASRVSHMFLFIVFKCNVDARKFLNYNCNLILVSVHFQSFASSFTLSLQREYAQYGIKVQLLTPFLVKTNMTKFFKAKNIFIVDVKSFCRWAIFTLGKTYQTTGYWSHAIQV